MGVGYIHQVVHQMHGCTCTKLGLIPRYNNNNNNIAFFPKQVGVG